jgi:hypothetical protein
MNQSGTAIYLSVNLGCRDVLVRVCHGFTK